MKSARGVAIFLQAIISILTIISLVMLVQKYLQYKDNHDLMDDYSIGAFVCVDDIVRVKAKTKVVDFYSSRSAGNYSIRYSFNEEKFTEYPIIARIVDDHEKMRSFIKESISGRVKVHRDALLKDAERIGCNVSAVRDFDNKLRDAKEEISELGAEVSRSTYKLLELKDFYEAKVAPIFSKIELMRCSTQFIFIVDDLDKALIDHNLESANNALIRIDAIDKNHPRLQGSACFDSSAKP